MRWRWKIDSKEEERRITVETFSVRYSLSSYFSCCPLIKKTLLNGKVSFLHFSFFLLSFCVLNWMQCWEMKSTRTRTLVLINSTQRLAQNTKFSHWANNLFFNFDVFESEPNIFILPFSLPCHSKVWIFTAFFLSALPAFTSSLFSTSPSWPSWGGFEQKNKVIQ